MIEKEQDSITIDNENITSVLNSVYNDSDIELAAVSEEKDVVENDMFRRKRPT